MLEPRRGEGAGDLRAYLLVQFWPLVAAPLILWLFPEGSRVKTRFIAYAIGAYVLARIAEALDPEIFAALGGALGGHTIKHLLAALGPVAIIAMMRSWPRAEDAGGGLTPSGRQSPPAPIGPR